MQSSSPKPENNNELIDESSPLSKRLRIELKDINKAKKRSKETCDIGSKVVVSTSNKHSTQNNTGRAEQKEMPSGKKSRNCLQNYSYGQYLLWLIFL